MKLKKMIFISIAVFLSSLIIIEVVALIRLQRSVDQYKKYWQETAKLSGELTYLALGDSAAQGIGASSPKNGYVGIIAKRLQEKTGKSVRIVNISKSGARVKDVINDQIPLIKKLKPDLVTIDIGGNDVATLDEAVFRKQFSDLVNLLPEGTYVSNMPYFGSRPKSTPKAFRATIIIEDIMKNKKELKLVDLQSITQERNSIFGYAADYFHPNDRAYKNWTDAFWQEIIKDQ